VPSWQRRQAQEQNTCHWDEALGAPDGCCLAAGAREEAAGGAEWAAADAVAPRAATRRIGSARLIRVVFSVQIPSMSASRGAASSLRTVLSLLLFLLVSLASLCCPSPSLFVGAESPCPCVSPPLLRSGDTVHVALLLWLDGPPQGLFMGDIADTGASAVPGFGSVEQPFKLGQHMDGEEPDTMRGNHTRSALSARLVLSSRCVVLPQAWICISNCCVRMALFRWPTVPTSPSIRSSSTWQIQSQTRDRSADSSKQKRDLAHC
jgi:hypothetical protein